MGRAIRLLTVTGLELLLRLGDLNWELLILTGLWILLGEEAAIGDVSANVPPGVEKEDGDFTDFDGVDKADGDSRTCL